MERLRRTMLFMPGNSPAMLQDAAILGADSIILDLEDAVSISEKDSARILVREAIKNVDYSEVELVVRINPLDTKFGREDLNVIAKVKPDAIMIPKADEESIIEGDKIIEEIIKENDNEGDIKIFPLIESAYGVENVYNIIKASKRVIGVLLGGEDLTADLGVKRTKKGKELFYARNKVAIACKALKVAAIDTPFTDTDDYDGLVKDAIEAKKLGMTGKAAINPRQIESIHSVYAPDGLEIKYALRVMEARDKAMKEGKGVFSLDGKMIDAPIINRAKTIIETASILGMI